MKKIHKTHRHICVRTTPLITNPNVSSLFGVGDSVWESAHRELRGKYRVTKERWAVMQGDFELEAGTQLRILVGQRGSDRPDSGDWGAPGGGGTFVVREDNPDSNEGILVVAGGGAGAPGGLCASNWSSAIRLDTVRSAWDGPGPRGAALLLPCSPDVDVQACVQEGPAPRAPVCSPRTRIQPPSPPSGLTRLTT